MIGFMACYNEMVKAKATEVFENSDKNPAYVPPHGTIVCTHKKLKCVFITSGTKYATISFYPLAHARSALKRRLDKRMSLLNSNEQAKLADAFIKKHKLCPDKSNKCWADDWDFNVIYHGDDKEESIRIANAEINKLRANGILVLNGKKTT